MGKKELRQKPAISGKVLSAVGGLGKAGDAWLWKALKMKVDFLLLLDTCCKEPEHPGEKRALSTSLKTFCIRMLNIA